MPNHLHGIIVLTDNAAVGARACPALKGRSKQHAVHCGCCSDIQIHFCYLAEPTIVSDGSDLFGSAIITNTSSEMKDR